MLSRRLLPLCTFSFLLPCMTAAVADDWPQWRGPNRDAVSRETGLLKQWPEGGPPVVWQVETAGVAYSSLSVADGRVFTQGDLDGVEHIIAYSERDGELLWAVQPAPVAAALAERIGKEFERLDQDKDGRIDELEALAGLGWNFNNFDQQAEGDADALAARRAAFLLRKLDTDNDGRISETEAPAAMQREFTRLDAEDREADPEAVAQSRAAEWLKIADTDGNGTISRNEADRTRLSQIFNRVDQRAAGENRGDGELTRDELSAYFAKQERGRDGNLTEQELTQYFAENFPGRDGSLTPGELRSYYGGYRNSYGDGPRGTPTVDGARLYAEGGNGDLTCLDAATGETLWHVNLVADLGGGRPGWGYSESPLIVDDWVIVTPGGKNGTLAALNKTDGTVVWRSEGMTQPAHYASPILATIAGIPQVVQFSRESLFGVALDDGRPLWNYSGANNGTANIATPIASEDYVLASSGYGTGAGLVKVSRDADGEVKADEVYFEKKLANHHGGLVKVGEYVYGFGSGLVCMNYQSGEIAWQSRSVGKGSLICVDGMLYILGEGQEVALAEATPEEYRERGRFKIDNLGARSWAHPVVANGRFYIRNLGSLTAYNVKAGE